MPKVTVKHFSNNLLNVHDYPIILIREQADSLTALIIVICIEEDNSAIWLFSVNFRRFAALLFFANIKKHFYSEKRI